MIIRILIVILFMVSSNFLQGSPIQMHLFNAVDKSDLIINGTLTHVGYYSGEVTLDNYKSLKDTAYIKIQKIYKTNTNTNNMEHSNVRLLIPLQDKRINDYIIKTIASDVSYKIGQNGIWLLREKDNAYTTIYNKTFHPISKEDFIIDFCKIKPHVLDFLQDLFEGRYDAVKQHFRMSLIDVKDSIFYHDETNPLIYAVKGRKTPFIQDIIDYGFDLNFQNKNGENALFITIRKSTKNLEIIEILLKNNIDTNVVNIQGISVYDLINKCKNKEKIFELFKKYNKKQSL